VNGSPAVFAIAFRTAHDRIGVAPLGSLRFGSEELSFSAACDCGDVQRRGLFCAGPDQTAADCDDASICLGKTGESFRVFHLAFCMLAVSIIFLLTCPQIFAIHCL
jgi:hypothetical protein